jgi:hypothetical protein
VLDILKQFMVENRDLTKDYDERNRLTVSNMGWGQYQAIKRQNLMKMNELRMHEVIQKSKIIEDNNRLKYTFMTKKWDIYREKVRVAAFLNLGRNVNLTESHRRGRGLSGCSNSSSSSRRPRTA